MNNLAVLNVMTMSSREIAELTGKRHSCVLRDIRKMLNNLYDLKDSSMLIDQQIKGVSFEFDNRGYMSLIYLDNCHAKLMMDKYSGLARVPNRLQEESALKTIEQILKITLIRQYLVGSYRIDGYDAVNNIAYEIDEPEHRYNKANDRDRQLNIEKILGCKFVRIEL